MNDSIPLCFAHLSSHSIWFVSTTPGVSLLWPGRRIKIVFRLILWTIHLSHWHDPNVFICVLCWPVCVCVCAFDNASKNDRTRHTEKTLLAVIILYYEEKKSRTKIPTTRLTMLSISVYSQKKKKTVTRNINIVIPFVLHCRHKSTQWPRNLFLLLACRSCVRPSWKAGAGSQPATVHTFCLIAPSHPIHLCLFCCQFVWFYDVCCFCFSKIPIRYICFVHAL